jgi:hypothetical protein
MGRGDLEEEVDEDGEDVVSASEAQAALAFGISLLLSLALAAPALWAAFNGQRELDGALLHYLLCFVVARVGVGIVTSLYGGYRRSQRSAQQPAVRSVPSRMTESR